MSGSPHHGCTHTGSTGYPSVIPHNCVSYPAFITTEIRKAAGVCPTALLALFAVH